MTLWCRVRYDHRDWLAQPEGDHLRLFRGELFGPTKDLGRTVDRTDIAWLPPVQPRQFLGLWNNFHERLTVEGTQRPRFPLYFVKLPGCLSAHEEPITHPPGFAGKVKVRFEAELGIVIGKRCFQPAREEIDQIIFGYTCVNDVTAPEPLFEDPAFGQWCRAKSFPSFGPVGPFVATGIEPETLRVRAVLDGKTVQDYPVADMIFSPREIVYRIAHEIPLYPGDLIACGTSLGAALMQPGQTVEVTIDGIGTLRNRFAG